MEYGSGTAAHVAESGKAAGVKTGRTAAKMGGEKTSEAKASKEAAGEGSGAGEPGPKEEQQAETAASKKAE